MYPAFPLDCKLFHGRDLVFHILHNATVPDGTGNRSPLGYTTFRKQLRVSGISVPGPLTAMVRLQQPFPQTANYHETQRSSVRFISCS